MKEKEAALQRVVVELGDVRQQMSSAKREALAEKQAAAEAALTTPVALLLSRGADVDATDPYGHTPLHLAASEGKVEVLAWLQCALIYFIYFTH